MKWSEIKKAVEQTGVSEDDEILEIHCELRDGNKTLQQMKLGDSLRLTENLSEEIRQQESAASGVQLDKAEGGR